ncbi:hypothetical protein CSV71_14885 [Sporosarcina sp. P21c]|nr:hypothetical protein CSV71_14885 [Sporosarcina sp. P21c]
MDIKKVNNQFHDALGGSVYISKILINNRGDKKVELMCKKCKKTSVVWTSYIYKGSWEVCEHDLD